MNINDSEGSAGAEARQFGRNGALRRDAALARARRARVAGNGPAAAFHEEVAAYQETHRIHEERHAALAEALDSGESVLEFEDKHGPSPQPTYLPKTPGTAEQ